jgi:hypothetical protein
MRKHTVWGCSLGLATLACSFALPAQNLEQNLEMASPPSSQSTQAMPARGQSMSQVERQYGAPAERAAAVGQPPITRWVYPSMVVYFEYDHVVHAVALQR